MHAWDNSVLQGREAVMRQTRPGAGRRLKMYVCKCYVCIAEIPTIIDPSATVNYLGATGSIIVGILVCKYAYDILRLAR